MTPTSVNFRRGRKWLPPFRNHRHRLTRKRPAKNIENKCEWATPGFASLPGSRTLPVKAPHAKHDAVDFIGGWREGLQVDANDIVVAHFPRQSHQQPPSREPPPVREQRSAQRLLELDVQFFHLKRPH